jgi:hypothetical protein
MSHAKPERNPVYGLIAEFEDAEILLSATKKAYSEGYRKMDAYSPFPIHGLADALGPEDHRVKWTIFFGGVVGAISGVALQYWVSVVAYPHNVGGKWLFSWPLFVPPAYEMMILFASFGAFLGMLGLNGLPKPYHPIFGAKRFERATQDRFFLCIETEDPQFDEKEIRSFLEAAGASEVSEVLHHEE